MVIKTLDPDPEPNLDSLEMLDHDPATINPDPHTASLPLLLPSLPCLPSLHFLYYSSDLAQYSS